MSSWYDLEGITVWEALYRGYKSNFYKAYKDLNWRYKYENVLTYYHMWRYVNEKKWPYFISPNWFCMFSGHHVNDCNNHSIRKPEHDECIWCEKPFPNTADLSQPISYWKYRAK